VQGNSLYINNWLLGLKCTYDVHVYITQQPKPNIIMDKIF